ncbi:hypothetical protein [Novosphingobium pentaromativorans]|uniref:Uncharacterized protein n=1 Tax=Novosphingobium pentaromativorans US6-1 TaxID=1088721 RepID=G6EEJ1_9SPHN|nr:hypothetical protein [Novosphingobium pentaromativorans]AIT79421.1 hypothetical protein JI59_06320 [Novosphingobium pentaromativorans US6-1]EHJ60236.1 hypothetical protein NSU_2762 [Novosphingobium pentaromativorans US6-1]
MEGEQLAFFLLLPLSLLLAVWKGGAPERYGALVIVAMAVIQRIAIVFVPSHFVSVDPAALVTDFVGLAGFGTLAVQARRIWPIWAASLQLLSVSAHFARWADIGVPPFVYALMRGSPTFLALAALLVGTILHIVRLKRHGADPSWQNWSRGSASSGPYQAGSSNRW